jgi:hypothetical protein
MASETRELSKQLAYETRRRKRLQAEVAELREELRAEMRKAGRDLELRTAELRAAQARVADLERTIRRIFEGGAYRLANRIWRAKNRTRALMRPGSGAARQGGGEEDLAEAAAEVVYGAGYADPRPTAVPGLADAQAQTGTPEVESGETGEADSADGYKPPALAVRLFGELDEEQLIRAVEDLEEEGRAPSELLVITDSDSFRALDGYGCRCEYVPPRADWERVGGTSPNYEDFVRARLLSIAGTHGVETLDRDELTARI